MTDVFISYSRVDSDFVEDLVRSLEADERDVWFDRDDIPFGADWLQEIIEGIQRSSVGIFVISPDSVKSQYCSLEVTQLQRYGKKIIPIVAVDIDQPLIDKLPEFIRSINWIQFINEPYDEAFGNLIKTIDTDLEAAKENSRILQRALAWQNSGHSPDLLSRGDELASFLPSVSNSDLTPLQSSFLQYSLSAAQKRYNFWRFVFGFIGGFLSLSFYVFAVTRTSAEVLISQPSLLMNVLSAGQIFGLFTGIIALFGSSLPEAFKRRLPRTLYLPTRIAVCLAAGTLVWVAFQWIFLTIPLNETLTVTAFIGGVAISLGFILNAFLKPPAIVTFLITAVSYYAMIFVLNSQSPYLDQLNLSEPLFYFDTVADGETNPVFTIGIPMTLLYALGTNAHILWQSVNGGNEVTAYLEGRKLQQATTEKVGQP